MRRANCVAAGLGVWLVLGTTACIPNRSYRVAPPGSVLHETPPSYCPGGNYTLSFVEFDDQGEMWDANQLTKAVNAIEEVKAQAPLVILFVHGWKNDASDQSGNVWGFRCELGAIAQRYKRTVIGVYIGWRGAVVSPELLKNFTFWNRITAAARIPGAQMTDTLLRIMRATKGPDGNDNATLLAVGHSFGGLVLERAVTQALVERINNAEPAADKKAGEAAEIRFPADLVVFVNEAGPAIQAKQLLDILSIGSAAFTNSAYSMPGPLLLSITSKGDTATHLAFPGGQFLSLPKVSLRNYIKSGTTTPEKDRFGIENQKTYYLHTTANTAAVQSHVIGLPTDTEVVDAVKAGNKPYACATLDVEQAARLDPKDDPCQKLTGKVYWIIPKAHALNTTPYWAMQMPVNFVPDHTNIFRPEFDALLTAFLNKRPDMMLRGVSNATVPAAPTLKLQKSR